jgi:hypothetical protein
MEARDLALDLLSKSMCKQQHGAVLFKGNEILGYGWNRMIVTDDGCESGIHAERVVLQGLRRKTTYGATLVVAGRRKKSGRFLLSRPCEKRKPWKNTLGDPCMCLVRSCGIRFIEYTLPGGGWEVVDMDLMRRAA